MVRDSSIKDFAHIVYGLLPNLGNSLIALTIATFLYELVKFVPPYIIKLIIDNIFLQPDFEYLILLVFALMVSLGVLVIIELKFVVHVHHLAAGQQSKLLERIFGKMLKLPMSWHEKNNSGTTISKVTKAANYANQLIWFINNDIIPIGLQMILTAGILFWADWRISLVYFIAIPILIWMIDQQFKHVQPFRKKYHYHYDESTKELAQSLYNIQTVKDYAQEAREAKTHTGLLKGFQNWVSKRAHFEFKKIINYFVIIIAARTIMLGQAIFYVLDGSLTPGTLVFIFTLTEKAFVNLHRLGRVYSFMGDTHESLDRALDILKTKNDLEDLGTKKPKKGDIDFVNVNFDYGTESILKGINVTFKNKKITAIVGPSGGGKTTLVKLATRQYDPTLGSITLAGTDLRDISLEKLRKQIAFVSQHTEIFDRTVHENIAYGNPKATRKQVIAAAKKANAHDFISSFHDGYNTLVGERGVRLSGGQRQRISIARAILANPDIIIFDEATSSLDSESENLIQKAVLSIKGKTLIIIAHRFSTIQHADTIVVLRDGKIVEVGNHKDLVKKKGGIYKRMQRLQKVGELRN